MAVPKTTQTRYMDGSVQVTQRTTQVTPSLHLFFHFCYLHNAVSSNLTTKLRYTFYSKWKRCRDGVTCVVLCVACTLPSIYLHVHVICVVLGTAVPTSLYIVWGGLLYHSTIQEVVVL